MNFRQQSRNQAVLKQQTTCTASVQYTCHHVVKRELFASLNVLDGKQCNPRQAVIQVVNVHSIYSHVGVALHQTIVTFH